MTSAAASGEGGGERLFVGIVDGLDRDDVEFDAEIFGQSRRASSTRVIRAESAGHGDADDFVLAQRGDGQGGGQGGIDSAGEAEHDAFESAFADVIAQAQHQGFVDGFDAGCEFVQSGRRR